MSLATKALLANLHISQWTGRKHDKRATGTVEEEYKSEKAVGNYTKKLLPGAKELDAVNRIAGGLREFFYEQSLPWCADGSRIISSKGYLEFTSEFRKRKTEFDNAVASFLDAYPTLRENARAKLGNLFAEGDYPTVSQLKGSFRCEVAFLPLPDVADFGTEILDSERDSFLTKMREVETNAMRECWTRLHDVVSKAAVRLQEPEAVFRDSLIQNIQDMCALLPKLNVTDNPDLERMRVEVEQLAAGMVPAQLRKSELVRTDAAQKLDAITSKMSVFMGTN